MTKANVFINKTLNETIIKFEIEIQNEIIPETFIILDIVSPNKPLYSTISSELFKKIIPNLNLEINTGLYFIYNEEGEAKYFCGSLDDFKT